MPTTTRDADLTDEEFEARLEREREEREERYARQMRLLWFVVTPCALAACVAGWIFSSAMEARAFNRATGSTVTTWDAMWIELRVQESAK